MTEQEQFEIMRDFDYDALIHRHSDLPLYSKALPKNAYYGFFLLAKYAGILLHEEGKATSPNGESRLSDLALSYLESGQEVLGGQSVFHKRPPFTFSLVNLLVDFLALGQSRSSQSTQYENIILRTNQLIQAIESARKSKSLIRSLDLYLARRWGRMLRVFVFLGSPVNYLPDNYSFEQDLALAAKRGQNKDYLAVMNFQVRFQRFRYQNKIGKLILLAEEWEMLCSTGEIQGRPEEYELLVLDLLDCPEHFRIGMEWVSMLRLRSPDNAAFAKWEIRFLRREGNFEQAVHMAKLALEKYTEDCETYCLLSNLMFLLGDYEEAKNYGRRAIEFGPDQAIAYVTLAYAYLYDTDYTRSIKQFSRAITLDNSIVDAYRGKSKALVMSGQVYEGMRCLITACRTLPDSPELYHDLADVYFMCGYLEESRRYCKRCLALDPECAGAYILLGMMEIRKNRDKSAGKWLKRALELEPGNPIALNELAYVYHVNGDEEECLRLLHEAIQIAPDFPDVLCSIGVVNYYQSRFDEALEYFEKTLELEPLHIGALVGKGNFYLAQSEAEEAILWYDKALNLDASYLEAIQGKASAYRSMGLEQEAFEWMQKAADTNGLESSEEE